MWGFRSTRARRLRTASGRTALRLAGVLVRAFVAWQTGGVHDVVCDLDDTLTRQDWPVADPANGVLPVQRALPLCGSDYSTPGCGTTTSTSARIWGPNAWAGLAASPTSCDAVSAVTGSCHARAPASTRRRPH